MSGLSLDVGSLFCSERFFSEFSGFPLSTKMNISKFQFDRMQDLPEKPLSGEWSFLGKYQLLLVLLLLLNLTCFASYFFKPIRKQTESISK